MVLVLVLVLVLLVLLVIVGCSFCSRGWVGNHQTISLFFVGLSKEFANRFVILRNTRTTVGGGMCVLGVVKEKRARGSTNVRHSTPLPPLPGSDVCVWWIVWLTVLSQVHRAHRAAGELASQGTAEPPKPLLLRPTVAQGWFHSSASALAQSRVRTLRSAQACCCRVLRHCQ